jgi:acyl-CoA synthetase (AMP-forming)/AMP-acid ligase II
MGFLEDDVIAFFMLNCPEYIPCLTGAVGVGFIVTPINPRYTVDELSRQLIMSRSKGIITTSSYLPIVKKALNQINGRNIGYLDLI